MDQKVFRVIKGYSELSYDQRKQIRELLEKYEDGDSKGRTLLIESLQKSLGPVSLSICPCCGR